MELQLANVRQRRVEIRETTVNTAQAALGFLNAFLSKEAISTDRVSPDA